MTDRLAMLACIRARVLIASGHKMCLIDSFIDVIKLVYTLGELKHLLNKPLENAWAQKDCIVYGLFPELKKYNNQPDDRRWFEYDEPGRISRLMIIDEIIETIEKSSEK